MALSLDQMSLRGRFSYLSDAERRTWLEQQSPERLKEMARGEWWWTARPDQQPPPGSWDRMLYLAGRGAGKTRASAEWLIQRALDYPTDISGFPTHWLVIGEKLADVKTINIESPSGFMRVLERRDIPYHYTKHPKPQITLTDSECRIHFQGADSPDVGRGFTAAGAILDEIAKWRYSRESWYEGILPSLRADIPGDHPRTLITTTPKPIVLLREWTEEAKSPNATIIVVRGSTYDNEDNLSSQFLGGLEKHYRGTRLGAQELYGELLDDIEGALFSYSMIERNRVRSTEGVELAHIVVGVDPTLTEEGDLMGVIIVGRSRSNHMYVLADESIPATGRTAADHIWRVFEKWSADTIAIENNIAKDWLAQVLRDSFNELKEKDLYFQDIFSADRALAFIDSRKGKKIRAEPVAMRYEQNTVHHVGAFGELEKEMLDFNPSSSHNSPDRMDALVHACRHLMAGEAHRIRVATAARHRIPRYSATY